MRGVSDVSAQAPTAAPPLAGYTTLRLGGPAERLITATNEDEILESVRGATGPLFVLAGGSNVVIGDDGLPGTVVLLRSRGIRVTPDGAGGGREAALFDVAAGEPWDDVVAASVERGYAGLECLSGIPGSAGATPIQNVGAYGQEVAETITAVRVYDRVAGRVRVLGPAACG
ncbi:MAG TPA: FAD-binding protein, partial [Micromonosporaceae bacterium]|nr:FAD-binding protein [Micromonosporaceae bacterium]